MYAVKIKIFICLLIRHVIAFNLNRNYYYQAEINYEQNDMYLKHVHIVQDEKFIIFCLMVIVAYFGEVMV
jgi:hypothetical protein